MNFHGRGDVLILHVCLDLENCSPVALDAAATALRDARRFGTEANTVDRLVPAAVTALSRLHQAVHVAAVASAEALQTYALRDADHDPQLGAAAAPATQLGATRRSGGPADRSPVLPVVCAFVDAVAMVFENELCLSSSNTMGPRWPTLLSPPPFVGDQLVFVMGHDLVQSLLVQYGTCTCLDVSANTCTPTALNGLLITRARPYP